MMRDKLNTDPEPQEALNNSSVLFCSSPKFYLCSQEESFLNLFYSSGQHMFAGKAQRAPVCFMGHTDSVASTHAAVLGVKTATDQMHTNHSLSLKL